MAQLREKREDRDVREWQIPDFTEVGKDIRGGRSWDLAWGDWLHELVSRKDARNLAAEPPSWFSAQRRAMMAGAAEFFANLYELPKPAWVDKSKYFLAVMEYQAYPVTEPDDRDFMASLPLFTV